MAECTCDIVLAEKPAARARELWKHTTVRRNVHAPLRDLLADMAAGRERCMYCGDNQGTDIDHFDPIDRHPIRAFDWTNHVLACSLCNSHLKKAVFPLDPGGEAAADRPHGRGSDTAPAAGPGGRPVPPADPQGRATIDLFDLNRGLLAKGRVNAFHVTKACVAQWAGATAKGDRDDAAHWAAVVNE